MSFRLRNSNSRMARYHPHRLRRFGERKKRKSMLEHSKSMRFGAVHSRGADVFFYHSPVGRKKIVFETGLHMAIKLQLRTLRRNVVHRHRKVGRGPRGGRFTFRKSEHQARHSQFAHWLSRWPAGLVRDRSGPSSIRRERSNKTKLPKAWSCWAKMQVSVGLWVGMYGYFSLSTNRKARELC